MFLLTRDEPAGRGSLERLRRRLGPFAPGPIVMERAGSHALGWFRVRQSDNLHAFRDGFLVGKLVPGERRSDAPIRHSDSLPRETHPLTRAVVIEVDAGRPHVRPRHAAGVFFDGDSISDMQLLLADHAKRRPSPESIALLGSVGYFPADLTLFREIRRVPFLHSVVPGEAPRREGRMPDAVWNDVGMIERLVGILPRETPATLAISGGCDSRFVLGLLLRAGIPTELVRLSDAEDAVAARLAAEAGVPLRVVGGDISNVPLPLYTAMTDGQIYAGGGHYSRLRDGVSAERLLYLGLFADSILKNAFRAAWKNPFAGGDLDDRLIREALLSRMREREPGLRAVGRRGDLLRFLRPEVAGSWPHAELRGRKQRANWFYYVHRGLRWTAAHTADLDFFAEVMLPLSDIVATASGIRSSAWSNFENSRVRALNEMLLPQVRTGYASGQSVRVARGPSGAVRKLYYEFGARGVAHLRQKRSLARPAAPAPTTVRGPSDEAPGFSDYFDRSLEAVLSDPDCSASVRRAASTTNEVLRYLSGVADADADASGVERASTGARSGP